MKTFLTLKTATQAIALLAWLLLPQAGHCFYNPSTGKWVSRDPLGERGGPNLDAFVANNPLGRIDVLGEEPYILTFESITVKRKHVRWLALLKERLGKKPSREDVYGHWWIEFDGESYGWWPREGIGLIETLTGVPGRLNGTDEAHAAGLASATRDVHEGDSAEEEFHPRRRISGRLEYGSAAGRTCCGATESEVKDCLKDFAKAYSGSWSYPWGQNCHSFQKAALKSCCARK